MWMLARGAAAQAPVAADPARRADVLVDYHSVSGGFGDWRSALVRLVAPSSTSRTVWQVEGVWRRAFGDEGQFVSAGFQHAFSPDWLASMSAGAGSGDFIFPDARLDVALSRKWLSRRQLVTTIGGTMVDAKRGYHDQGTFVSAALYALPAMVVEGGARWNRSTPGDVTSTRAFGAVTLGTERRRWIVARGSTGNEGYQLVGPVATLERFNSHEASVSWREWLGRNWGVLLQGEHYTNPHYERTGVTGGFFIHW